MRQLSWGATLKLNWGATLKWSEAPLWPKSGSPTNLMSCQSLAPTNLVWFPDWHECHFPSGLGNLTTLQTAPHLIHQHLKKNQTIFTLLHSWNVIQSESEMWQCRTDQFEKWCQKLVTEQHSTCLNFHCCLFLSYLAPDCTSLCMHMVLQYWSTVSFKADSLSLLSE